MRRFLTPLIVIFLIGLVSLMVKSIMGRQKEAEAGPTASAAVETPGIASTTAASAPGENTVAPAALHYPDLDKVRIPAGVPSQEVDYTGFRLSFNKENGTPNWVAWELLGSETDGAATRGSRKFFADYDVDGCPENSDYSNSGYDRGHMCPAADQKWSEDAMTDCFVMTNMCPQDHALNSGAWSTLEKRERIWAQRDSAIVIVSGPIYEKSDRQRIGDAEVRVPSAFFKVFVAPYLAQPRGIAFVYPNMTAPGSMEQYVMTIDEVERITGYDFFYALPDDIETAVESSSSFKDWNRNPRKR